MCFRGVLSRSAKFLLVGCFEHFMLKKVPILSPKEHLPLIAFLSPSSANREVEPGSDAARVAGQLRDDIFDKSV
jgi:hypothetical protein